ncbi:MAG: hypothetical protein ACR2K5_01055 [Pseudolabrys sp.]
MSGDLISLRMLVISAFRLAREIWRQGAALASVPIEFLEAEPAQAAAHLAKGGIDIVMLDAALAEPDRNGAIKRARLKSAPLIAISGDESEQPRWRRCDARQTGGVEEARAWAERCVRARLPIRVLVVDDSTTMRSIVQNPVGVPLYAGRVRGGGSIAALNLLSAGKGRHRHA